MQKKAPPPVSDKPSAAPPVSDKPPAAPPVADKKRKAATSQAPPAAGKKAKKPTSPASLERKRETLPRQSKEKPLERYADEGAAVSKRKQRVGKPGRRDPREEFGYGGVKKKRAPAEKYDEDEEEWEDEDVVDDVVVLSDADEERDEEEEILFERHTKVRNCWLCNQFSKSLRNQFCNYLQNLF